MKIYSHEAGSPAENKNEYNIQSITVNLISTLKTSEQFSAEATNVVRLQKVIWSMKSYPDLIFLRSMCYSRRVPRSSYLTVSYSCFLAHGFQFIIHIHCATSPHVISSLIISLTILYIYIYKGASIFSSLDSKDSNIHGKYLVLCMLLVQW